MNAGRATSHVNLLPRLRRLRLRFSARFATTSGQSGETGSKPSMGPKGFEAPTAGATSRFSVSMSLIRWPSLQQWMMPLAVAVSLYTGGVRAQSASNEKVTIAASTLAEAIWGRDEAKPVEVERRIDPDRPHFPEAATAVGNGRVVLEGGYTYTNKAGALTSHSYPESLLRVGAFTDWFEFRIGQNFASQQQTVAGMTTSSSGPQDLYLGAKVALTPQRGWFPATALIPQMTVPTGNSALTAGRVLPGINLDLAWEVVEERVGIEVLIANNQVQDELGAIRHELATGFTGTFQITKELELFAEWDAFYAFGGLASTAARHYAVGGAVYFLTPNLALDARAGLGLNSASNDLILGVGFAVRF